MQKFTSKQKKNIKMAQPTKIAERRIERNEKQKNVYEGRKVGIREEIRNNIKRKENEIRANFLSTEFPTLLIPVER